MTFCFELFLCFFDHFSNNCFLSLELDKYFRFQFFFLRSRLLCSSLFHCCFCCCFYLFCCFLCSIFHCFLSLSDFFPNFFGNRCCLCFCCCLCLNCCLFHRFFCWCRFYCCFFYSILRCLFRCCFYYWFCCCCLLFHNWFLLQTKTTHKLKTSPLLLMLPAHLHRLPRY